METNTDDGRRRGRARETGPSRTAAALAAAVALAALAGCGSAPRIETAGRGTPVATASPSVPATDPELERRIAADLVGVLSRVDEVSPTRAPDVRVASQVGEPGFARALEEALLEAGYRLENAPPGRRVTSVGYAVQRGLDGDVPTATYTIALAEVQARRSWSMPAGLDGGPGSRWIPAGPLYVRGVDAATIDSADPDTGSSVGVPATLSIAAPARGAGATPSLARADARSRAAIDPRTD